MPASRCGKRWSVIFNLENTPACGPACRVAEQRQALVCTGERKDLVQVSLDKFCPITQLQRLQVVLHGLVGFAGCDKTLPGVMMAMGGAVNGDFGLSFRHQQPALDLVLERLPATLELALASLAWPSGQRSEGAEDGSLAESERFVERVRESTARYQDRALAVADGYRLIGQPVRVLRHAISAVN